MNTETEFDYVTDINESDNTYLTAQLRQNLNINLKEETVNNDNFMKVIREMYSSHENYRRTNMMLEKKVEKLSYDVEERDKLIGRMKNRSELERENRVSQENAFRNQINEFQIELNKAKGIEKANNNEINRLKKEIQILKQAQNKASVNPKSMEVIGKGFYKTHISSNSKNNDFYTNKLHESQQIAMKDIQSQIDQRNGSLIQMLTQMVIFCKPRRDYIMSRFDQMKDRESVSSFADLNKLFNINIETLDMTRVDLIEDIIKKCIAFLNSFDAFLCEDFKSFMQQRTDRSKLIFDFEKSLINIKNKEEMTKFVDCLRDINVEQEKTIKAQNDLIRINPQRNEEENIQKLLEKCKLKTGKLNDFINKHNLNIREHQERMREQDMKIEEAHQRVNEVMDLYNSSNKQLE